MLRQMSFPFATRVVKASLTGEAPATSIDVFFVNFVVVSRQLMHHLLHYAVIAVCL